MSRYNALKKEWSINPPVALLLKSFMGVKDYPELPDGAPGESSRAQQIVSDFEE